MLKKHFNASLKFRICSLLIYAIWNQLSLPRYSRYLLAFCFLIAKNLLATPQFSHKNKWLLHEILRKIIPPPWAHMPFAIMFLMKLHSLLRNGQKDCESHWLSNPIWRMSITISRATTRQSYRCMRYTLLCTSRLWSARGVPNSGCPPTAVTRCQAST